jgi:hypothetical protein
VKAEDLPIIYTDDDSRRPYSDSDRVVLTGDVGAFTQEAQAMWTLLDDDATAPISFLTPTTSYINQGSSEFQALISAYALTPGLSYTFQLSAKYTCDTCTDTASTSTVHVTVNKPPRGGNLIVTPVIGTSLLTVFYLSSYYWVDDVEDMPLNYAFQYYTVHPSEVIVTKKSGEVPYHTSYISQGLQQEGYIVTCLVIAIDVYGSEGNASVQLIVLPPNYINAAITTSSTIIDESLANEDLTALTQAVSASLSYINSVDCTVPQQCSSINRQSCSATEGTCGPCLASYVGPSGDSNIACQAEGVYRATGDVCTNPNQCVGGLYTAGVCAERVKECPDNCGRVLDSALNTIISTNNSGVCVYSNINGIEIGSDECLISDTTCSATCLCPAGSRGKDCSLNNVEVADLRTYREYL